MAGARGPSAARSSRRGNLIAGNLGGQYATGNTFGGWLLATEVLPALDRLLGDDYEVQPVRRGPFSEPWRMRSSIPASRTGFVDDIDAELQATKVFLLCNNGNPDFVVGHTRICTRGRSAPPRRAREHGAGDAGDRARRDALLGSTGEELAEHVVAACRDETLRRRIIEGGRRTWEREFRPEVVVERIVRRVESDLRLGSASPAAGRPTPAPR